MPLGRAAVRRPGRQVTVVAYGLMVHYALEAAERVAGEGIDCRGHRPAHAAAARTARRCSRPCARPASASIAYEDNRFGGYGAEIAAIVAEEAFDYLDGPVTRIAGPDVPACRTTTSLEDWFMLNPAQDRGRDPQARGVLMAAPTAELAADRGAPAARSSSRTQAASRRRRSTASRRSAGRAPRRHDWFAFVKPASKHVGFYLLPMHTYPELREGLSPALAKRLTGKSTFTFAAVDEALFVELEGLVARAYEVYMADVTED